MRPSSFVTKALMRWVNVAQDDSESPLVWHDHASAFRLRKCSKVGKLPRATGAV